MKKELIKIETINEGSKLLIPLTQSSGLGDEFLERTIEYGICEGITKDNISKFIKYFGSNTISYELERMPYLDDTDLRIYDIESGMIFETLKLKIKSSNKEIELLLRTEINKDLNFYDSESKTCTCLGEVESLNNKELEEMCLGFRPYDLQKLIAHNIDTNTYKRIELDGSIYETFFVNCFVLEELNTGNVLTYFSGTKFNNETVLNKVFDTNKLVEQIIEYYFAGQIYN